LTLNEFGFVKTDGILPFSTSKTGIYAAGAMQGVKDIPESVIEASAAACRASIDLASARGSLVKKNRIPEGK